MNENEIWDLMRKKDCAQYRAKMFSCFLLVGSASATVCMIAGFFYRLPVWFFGCLVFTVASFVFGFAVIYFRKIAKKIKKKMKPLMGGSGAGRSRYSVTPTTLKETEE